MFAYLWGLLVYGIIFGVVTNIVIKNKGYEENWFWWGFLFGVFALIVACTKPSKVVVTGIAQVPSVDSSIPQAIGSEKDYDTLYAIPERQYSVGSPIVINEGKLLKEKETGRIFAKCDFQIVTDKKLKGAFVSVLEYDVSGDYLGKTDTQYLDLDRMDGILFGSDHQIALSNIVTRKIEIKCTKVIFADDTKWEAEGAWHQLPAKVSLSQSLGGDLASQYKLEVNDKAQFNPQELDGLWICSCGCANDLGNDKCVHCGVQKASVFDSLNQVELRRKYVERTVREQEAERQKEATNKKRNKLLVIAVVIVSIMIAIGAVAKNKANQAKVDEFIRSGDHHGTFYYREKYTEWYNGNELHLTKGERLEISRDSYYIEGFDTGRGILQSTLYEKSGTYDVKIKRKSGKDVFYIICDGRQFQYDGYNFTYAGRFYERSTSKDSGNTVIIIEKN